MFDINLKLKKYIKKFYSKKIMICDIGISSGQSTLELFSDLKKIKIKHIYGLDKQIFLKIYKIRKLIFMYSLRHELLMVEYNKFCLRYRYYILFKIFEKPIIYLLNFANVKYVKTDVLTPNLNYLDKIKFLEQDIFRIEKKYSNLFDVVRISNLLNYSYFSKAELKKAILNIKKISKNNSIILVSKTTDKQINVGSFFRKNNGKFELIEDFNGGSEIKKLMLSC